MRVIYWLTWLLFSGSLSAQEAVPILSVENTAQGTPSVSIATDPTFYYVLFGPQDRARALVRGTGSIAVLTEALATRPAAAYTVRRYPVGSPRDLDNDGTDDLTEFNNTPSQSPFNPTPPLNLVDGASLIPDQETFDALAFTSSVPANNNPLSERPLVKFYVTDNDADSMRLYFMNTNTHEAHLDFATALNIPVRENGNSFFEDMRGLLVYHPEVTAPNGEVGVYTFQFQPFDEYPCAIIERIFEALGANLPFLQGNLAYLPLHQRAINVYNQNRELYEASRIPVYLEGDLYEAIDYLALNVAEGYGKLRLMEPDERPNSRDVVVYETLPNDLPRVGGIITTVIQTPLSHVNLRALQDNVPNAYIRDALVNADVANLLDQNVYYRADPEGYLLRAATPQEIEDWYDALRPDSITIPDRDLSITSITPLDDIHFEQAPAFGAKTANLATMRDFGFRPWTIPDGYGIPLFFYDAFMQHNGFYDRAAIMLANEAFRNDFAIQEAMLADFRDDIEAGSLPEWMFAQLTELQQSFPQGTNIRCRSSTNNEDLPGFSGAGLYKSKTHKTTEGHISKTIKEVFAGLWTFRAFAEREFFRIDHLTVGMGVLCHPNFKEERANGVAVTIDPVYQTAGTYYLNTQIGEDLVTTPEAFSLPEEVLLDKDGIGPSGYEIRRRSNLLPPGEQVLAVPYLDSLRTLLSVIHTEFAELYNATENESFGMDVEYKVDSSAQLVIKQARPWIGYLDQLSTSTNATADTPSNIRAYPTPINANTTIDLRLNRPARVDFLLVDVSGHPVRKILQQPYPAGEHQIPLHANQLTAGAYVLWARIRYADRVEYATVKLVR
ncbi:MAG: PEP/pyruvate-binding domain-containing protein [Bacteroidota bacterium]